MRKILCIALLLLLSFDEMGTLTWDTDFETVQWSSNGSAANGDWETGSDSDINHINEGRVGKAIHLGDFGGSSSRNEIKINRGANWNEHWIGWSMKVTEALPSARTLIQFRNTRASGGVGDGVINPVTLRQRESPDQLYFQTSTIAANKNTIYTSGASTGCASTYFDYTLDVWMDIVIHWILDPDNGLLEIWVDGEKIIDHTGTTTYKFAHIDGEAYDGDIGIQMGTYWGSSNTPQGNVHYDEFKMREGSGDTYEDVHPLGLSPNGGDVTAITWDNDTQVVNTGGFLDLGYAFTPNNPTDTGFSLSSSNTGVVSNTGAVVGVGTANLTIMADDTTNGTITDIMAVTVNAAPTGTNNGKGGPKGKLIKIMK